MRQLGDGGFAAGMAAFGEGLQSLEDRLRKRHEDKLKLLVEQQGGDWRRAAEVARKDPKLAKSWRYITGMEPDPEAIPSTYQMTDEEKAESARIKAGLEPTRSQRLESIHRAEQMTGRVMPHEMYTEWANMPDPYENVKESLYRETQPYWGITEQPMPFVPREYESQYPGVGYQMNEMLPGSRAARQTAYTANAISQREARKARTRQADERLAFQKEKEETDKKEEEERQKEIRRWHDAQMENERRRQSAKQSAKQAPKPTEEEIKYKVGEISQLTKIDWDNYKSAKKAADDFRSMLKPSSIWPKAVADAEQARLDKIAADLAKTYQDKVNGLIGVKQSAPATSQPAPATGKVTKRWGDELPELPE